MLILDLEQQRSKAGSQLNSLRDPMARLPREIQSHIFLDVEPSLHRALTDPDNNPLVLLRVCRLWRVIALSTPRLWTDLSMISLPRSANYTLLCREWMERARPHHLSLTLEGSLVLDYSVQTLMTQYEDRIQSLTLKLDDSLNSRLSRMIRLQVDALFPALQALKIMPQDCGDMHLHTIDDLLDVLRAAPYISHCMIYNMLFREETEHWEEFPLLTIASLEQFELQDPLRFMSLQVTRSSAAILRYLTLPALKHITLTDFDITHDELVAFFSRSSAPLRSLDISMQTIWDDLHVDQLLRLMPSLTALHLYAVYNSNSRFQAFVDILGTELVVLPDLRVLRLSADSDHSTPIDYEGLIRMLNIRRTSCATRLECFELYFATDFAPLGFDLPLLSSGVKSALQQLVTDGLEVHVIHVDDERKNLLD
ncbi:hypothetical protein R3P38DRAFT_3058106 [Favolaschia claudopus]|uniref:F-box domain-containing protein n=1 Tax=Favolaschia claudopus TaxID=2862362 RepID=A0AAW0A371_9AGAR